MAAERPPIVGWIREVVALEDLADDLERHGLRIVRLEWTDGLPRAYCELIEEPPVEPTRSEMRPTRNQS